MTNTVTVNGHTYTDDADPSTGMGNGGHRTRLVPMLADAVVVAGQVAADRVQTGLDVIATAASAASAAAIAGAFVGTSATSWTPAIGPAQTFATQAGEQYTPGATLTIVSASTPSDWGAGQVTGYSGSTLVMDIQVIHGTGTHTDWNISIAGVQGPPGIVDAATLAAATHAAASKTTPADADELALIDSAAANSLKKLTLADLKRALLAQAQATALLF